MFWTILVVFAALVAIAITVAKDLARDEDPPCDKCGRPVPVENNASLLVRLIYQGDMTKLGKDVHENAPHRHLKPLMRKEKVLCKGSPSLLQYLEGQPRDSRRDYSYRFSEEPRIRAAYKEMQELVGC